MVSILLDSDLDKLKKQEILSFKTSTQKWDVSSIKQTLCSPRRKGRITKEYLRGSTAGMCPLRAWLENPVGWHTKCLVLGYWAMVLVSAGMMRIKACFVLLICLCYTNELSLSLDCAGRVKADVVYVLKECSSWKEG